MYLVTAKYTTDAERKRIEYAFGKWNGKLGIAKPEGLVAIVDSDDIEGLVEELYSRSPRENIELYRIEKVHLDVAEVEREMKLRLREKRETVERLVDFIMARQKAVLKLELREPPQKVYEVYTRKGKAEIVVSLQESGGGVSLGLRISGYGEAVELIHRRLEEQLRLLEEAR